MEKSYLRSGQVAKLFGVERRTVTGWAKRGRPHPTDNSIGGHYRFSRQEVAGMTIVPESWLPNMNPTGTCVYVALKLSDLVNALFEWLKEKEKRAFYINDKLKSKVCEELNEQIILLVLPQDIDMKHLTLREGTEKLSKAVSAISPKVEQLLKEEVDNVIM